MIKNKFKEFLRVEKELKQFKVQTMLALEYKTRNGREIVHSSTKLTASDSDIDEAFKSMHQSIITKMKKRIGMSQMEL